MKNINSAVTNNNTGRLFMGIDLSNAKWKICFGDGSKNRIITIEYGDFERMKEEIKKSRNRFKLSEESEVYSCYEAGRDGFWIHRELEGMGIINYVVDSSSIEVNRRQRQRKNDKIDAIKLQRMLIRYHGGERGIWSVIHIPGIEDEDIRRINRELKRLKKERTGHTNRIKSLLIMLGIKITVGKNFLIVLDNLKMRNGSLIPPHLKKEIVREYERYELIEEQIKDIREEQKNMKKATTSMDAEKINKVKKLEKLKGIGEVSSWELVMEFFGWRNFKNRREVGGAAGLVPTPWSSGNMNHELGISKAGNRTIRALMIELSWGWLYHQPQSKLSQWFIERFGSGNKRMRKIGIVAMARKLLIKLWNYLEKDEVPEGAIIQVKK